MSPEDREQLNAALTALAAGKRASGDVAYRLLMPPVRALCGRLLAQQPNAVEDAVQETLVKVFQRVNTFDSSRDGFRILGWAWF